MKKTTVATPAAPEMCKASRTIYLKGGRPVRTECSLPKGHMDGPLLGKQVTHHDAVYRLSWKGRGR